MQTLVDGFKALVIGSSGGIGKAVIAELDSLENCAAAVGLSRQDNPGFDLTNHASISDAARKLYDEHKAFDLIFDATGALNVNGTGPEKSLNVLDADVMARMFAVNTIGPAMLIRHFAPLLSTRGKSVLATLSARVGSIGDNRLGGWYAYRASKAALNQLVRTAAIEIARKHPQAVCLALHPGTVETALSQQHARGRFTHTPRQAARSLLQTIDNSSPDQSGSFLAYDGSVIPW